MYIFKFAAENSVPLNFIALFGFFKRNQEKDSPYSLLFSFIPLPLHSQIKMGNLKFFQYVSENKDQTSVLRSQLSR